MDTFIYTHTYLYIHIYIHTFTYTNIDTHEKEVLSSGLAKASWFCGVLLSTTTEWADCYHVNKQANKSKGYVNFDQTSSVASII